MDMNKKRQEPIQLRCWWKKIKFSEYVKQIMRSPDLANICNLAIQTNRSLQTKYEPTQHKTIFKASFTKCSFYKLPGQKLLLTATRITFIPVTTQTCPYLQWSSPLGLLPQTPSLLAPDPPRRRKESCVIL